MEKNSFVFYHSWAEIIEKLPPDDVKNLLLALIDYAKNGTAPQLSPLADVAFTAFRQSVDRDTTKWENTCKRNAENVKRRWEKNGNTKNTTAYDRTKSNTGNTDNDNDSDSDFDNEIKSPLSPKGEADGFEDFWKAYPLKRDKPKAQKAWNKLKPSKETLNAILASVERWKQSEQWRKDNGQYIPYPATWLNGRRWEDPVGQPVQPPQPTYEFDPNDPYKAWREREEKKYEFDPNDPYKDWV